MAVSARAHFHPDFTLVSPRFSNLRGQQLALPCVASLFLPSRSHGFDSRLPLHPASNVTTYVRSERPPTGEPLLSRQVLRGSFGVLPDHFGYPLAAPDPVELPIRRKDPGLQSGGRGFESHPALQGLHADANSPSEAAFSFFLNRKAG